MILACNRTPPKTIPSISALELDSMVRLAPTTAAPRIASTIQSLNIELYRERNAEAGPFMITFLMSGLMSGCETGLYYFLRVDANGASVMERSRMVNGPNCASRSPAQHRGRLTDRAGAGI
jgi:hypothetical protein